MKSFSPGLSDSIASVIADPAQCPHCDSSSHVAGGLCVGCLLQAGLDSDDQCEPEALASAFAEVSLPDKNWRLGNYEILEEIGRGGMGVIYRARQRHSRRIVAVKRVLSYHSDSRETLARFRREAQAAASLDHPNILPIYEVSESEDGLPFFSMKFAPGGNLQEVGPALKNDTRQCVALVAKVARAVQYAHAKGILHRDLKPGNILLDGRGEPLVSDFGLAKWLDTTSDLTRTLTIFGTPGYIAPEQAAGPAAQLKPAADVYSLGAILFDLLAGRPPFLGTHALSVIRQASESPAPKLRTLSKIADRDLETICAHCLERDPKLRYPSAHDLATDLERWLEGRPIITRAVSPPVRIWRWSRRNPVLAGSVAAVILIGSLGLARQIESRRLGALVYENQLNTHSVAILPFLNLDNADAEEDVASALKRALESDLASFGPARIVALRGASFLLPRLGFQEDVNRGGQTKTRTLLSGTKRTVNGKYRISLRLVSTSNHQVLWRRLVDYSPTDSTAAFPREIAAQIYQVLEASDWSRLPSRSRDSASFNRNASDFIAAGRLLIDRRNVADTDRAIECFQKAIQADPSSAVAYANLALAAVGRSFLEMKPGLMELAETSAQRALQLNPELGEAHRALSAVLDRKGDFATALEEAFRSIELDGVEFGSVGRLASTSKLLGRPDAALKWNAIVKAVQAHPAGDDFMIGDCWADLAEDARAEAAYQRTSALHPGIPEGWIGLCRLRLLQKRFSEAQYLSLANRSYYAGFGYTAQMTAQVEFFRRNFAEAEKLYLELTRSDPGGGGHFYGAVSYQSAIGQLRRVLGDEQAGQKILDAEEAKETLALASAPRHPEILYRLAAIKASLGDVQPAVDYLRRAFEAGWIDYRSLDIDPRFDAIRQDSAYRDVFEAMASRVSSLRRSRPTDIGP
jgi:serine/threonine protein kinase